MGRGKPSDGKPPRPRPGGPARAVSHRNPMGAAPSTPEFLHPTLTWENPCCWHSDPVAATSPAEPTGQPRTPPPEHRLLEQAAKRTPPVIDRHKAPPREPTKVGAVPNNRFPPPTYSNITRSKISLCPAKARRLDVSPESTHTKALPMCWPSTTRP